MLSLLVRGAARTEVPMPLRRQLRRRLLRAMTAAQVGDAPVCLSLSDDAELLALNQQYADEDHATDVLSFAQREQRDGAPGLPAPADPAAPLGDIIISVETAARQANAQGHDLDAELLHLSVHGLAHLLGYDHRTKAEERVMFGYEALLRAQAQGHGPIVAVEAPKKPRAR